MENIKEEEEEEEEEVIKYAQDSISYALMHCCSIINKTVCRHSDPKR